jgi:hypothetical protein
MKHFIFLILIIFSFTAYSSIKTDIPEVIVEHFNLPFMNITIEQREAELQEVNAKVKFKEALGLALKSLLNDNDDLESPLVIIRDRALTSNLKRELHNHMNKRTTTFRLLKRTEEAASGEIAGRYWIFEMYIEDLSDHFYYVIIDKNGFEKTYNYGYN